MTRSHWLRSALVLAAWLVAGRMHPNLGVPVRERRRVRPA